MDTGYRLYFVTWVIMDSVDLKKLRTYNSDKNKKTKKVVAYIVALISNEKLDHFLVFPLGMLIDNATL